MSKSNWPLERFRGARSAVSAEPSTDAGKQRGHARVLQKTPAVESWALRHGYPPGRMVTDSGRGGFRSTRSDARRISEYPGAKFKDDKTYQFKTRVLHLPPGEFLNVIGRPPSARAPRECRCPADEVGPEVLWR